MKHILKSVMELRECDNKKLSELTGLSLSYIVSLMNGNRVITEDLQEKLSQALLIDKDIFKLSPSEVLNKINEPVVSHQEKNELECIKLYEKINLNKNNKQMSNNDLFVIYIMKRLLIEDFNIDSNDDNQIQILRVLSDDMSPKLQKGDFVVIDIADKNLDIHKTKTMLFEISRFGQTYYVAREVEAKIDGRVFLRSLNPKEEVELNEEEFLNQWQDKIIATIKKRLGDI